MNVHETLRIDFNWGVSLDDSSSEAVVQDREQSSGMSQS
jgi:hypothetical protein